MCIRWHVQTQAEHVVLEEGGGEGRSYARERSVGVLPACLVFFIPV